MLWVTEPGHHILLQTLDQASAENGGSVDLLDLGLLECQDLAGQWRDSFPWAF